MDKKNNSNAKGEARIAINNNPKPKSYKKTPPRYKNFKGEPTE
ncbi:MULTISPECIES: hypothetical protein [Clostridium]|nr:MULTISPECIES: hypothetical protein [Clostridium]